MPINFRWVLRVAFTRDGKQAIATTNKLTLLDLATGNSLKRFEGYTLSGSDGNIQALDVSLDGTRVASGDHFGNVRLWDLQSGKLLKSFIGHTGGVTPIYQVAFSPDQKKLLTASVDKTARLWDVATGEQLLLLQHNRQLNTASFSPGGRFVSTGGLDQMVRVWDAATGKELLKLAGHEGPVWALRFTPDGKHLISSSSDGTMRMWRLPDALVDPKPTNPAAPPKPLVDGTLPLKPGEVLVFRGHTDGLLAMAVSPDGKFAVTGGSCPNNKEGALRMWDLATGKEVKQFHGHDQYVFNITYSPDGKKLLSASQDRTARVWDVERGTQVAGLGIGQTDSWKFSVAFTPDGVQAIVTSEKPRLYDLATKKDLDRFEKYTAEQVRAAALSPDGATLATGDGASGKVAAVVSLWDVKSGKRVKALSGHKSLIYSLAWSPDGKRLASACDDGTVRVWNPNGGKEVNHLEHPRPVNGVAYSPGGKFLLTGCYDHAVRVWDAASGELVHTLNGHDLEVWTVAFTPDGKHALSVSLDKTLRMWRLPDALVDPPKKP